MAKDKDRQNRQKDAQRRAMIVKWDHPALSTKCEPVQVGDDLSFISTMKQACRATKTGVGLAACQVGVLKCAVFIAPPHRPSFVMLNPIIVERSAETETKMEGCLSYPGIETPVTRFKDVRIQYYKPEDALLSTPVTEWFYDFTSRICQHELDHTLALCAVGDAWRREQKNLLLVRETDEDFDESVI